MKIKNIIKTIVIILILLVLAIAILFKLFGASAIKTGIEVVGTQTLRVPVTVGNVDLNLLAGKAGITDLVIANPAGYANPTMIEMGKIRVDLDLGSLMSDTIRIEHILLDEVSITLEQKGLTNNIQQILDSLPKSEEETTKEQPEKTKTETGQKNLEITKLELTNISVNVKLLPIPGKADTLTLKLSPIIMENLGTESKVDMAILTNKILVAIVTGIAEQGAGILPADMIGPMGDTIKSLGATSEALIKEGKKILEGTGDIGKSVEEIGKGIEKIGKGLGELFKKKDGKKN